MPSLALPQAVDLHRADLTEKLSNEDVWELFLEMIEREGPVRGLGSAISPYRSLFLECAVLVRSEHAFVRATYYRAVDDAPLLNPFHLEHLTRLLHAFSHSLYKSQKAGATVLDCLFYVMKKVCGVNLFYRQPLSRFFLPRHSLGSIFGYGEWGPCLIVTQGCTIGQNKNKYPKIGRGVMMGPQSMILGDCIIGDNVSFAAGAMVIDTVVPDNTVVFGHPPDNSFRPNRQDNIEQNFLPGIWTVL